MAAAKEKLSGNFLHFIIIPTHFAEDCRDKNSKNVLRLEIMEVILVHCRFVNNYYQKNSKSLYTFVSNKPVHQL